LKATFDKAALFAGRGILVGIVLYVLVWVGALAIAALVPLVMLSTMFGCIALFFAFVGYCGYRLWNFIVN
jgi:hypothetical protein